MDLKSSAESTSGLWRLKTRSWLEVRPYEWNVTETERTKIARSARMALKQLKIPESDPAWSHVIFRAGNAKLEKKIIKEKNPTKAAVTADMQIRDESVKGFTSASKTKDATKKSRTSNKGLDVNDGRKSPTEFIPKPLSKPSAALKPSVKSTDTLSETSPLRMKKVGKVTAGEIQDKASASEPGKRKTLSVADERPDSPKDQKRRKLDESETPSKQPLHGSLPKKPIPASSMPLLSKSKPLATLDGQHKRSSSTTALPIQSNTTGSTRAHSDQRDPNALTQAKMGEADTDHVVKRRRIAEYTSSSSDGEVSPLKKSSKKSAAKPRTVLPKYLPKDRTELQIFYDSTYPEYLQAYARLTSHKRSLTQALARVRGDDDNVSVSSGDTSDIMDINMDELGALKQEYQRLHADLTRIKDAQEALDLNI